MRNKSVVTGLFAAITALGALAAPADAAHKGQAVPPQHTKSSAATQSPARPINEALLQAEVQLARAGFSPGTIDGREGENFANALRAFQQANGLAVGPLDQATSQRLAQLSSDPVLGRYTIQPDDVAGPFAPAIQMDFAQMAQLPALSYRNPRQLLAEKFHMSERLLAALNSAKNFAEAGATITVANVAPMAQSPAAGPAAWQGSGSSGERGAASPRTAAERVVVDKPNHAVIVYGADNRLIAFYPASIGSAEKPALSGRFTVRSVAYNPTYTYNPAYDFKEQKSQRVVKVAAGPNNPVGVVWIGLSAKGYGIHGTPEPDKVGKTQSHGCVRLTNWNALALAKLVKRGTPVDFVG
jgi:lipoprotein-anchoring transpeptidase ErfK/SrfK